ncbi:MAG: vWA domain-containing protein [Pseudomonadota bacterium]|nr:vWA domain-containing protein [Pseudomonadota bacterium]
MKNGKIPTSKRILWHWGIGLITGLLILSGIASAQGYGFAAPGGYGLKIYRVDYALYPFVQLYLRTFDADMQPLVNLNERNIGLMVKGRPYDPAKRQYGIQSIRKRQEATRTVLVIDASKSMLTKPFEASLRAAVRYIESKRPQDQVAVLSIRDTKEGYDVVSQFEKDERALVRRIADIKADGMHTRLYDSVAAALQMCGMSAQGSINTGEYVISCSVVVFSDGKDEGSAISRDELMTRISNLRVPIPIYSLAYSKVDPSHFRNLEALSKNSFGIYYNVGETTDRMQRIVEEIQNILQSDYVVLFRSYIPVDGEQHGVKLGVEYPTGSGKYVYDNESFESIQPPPVPEVLELQGKLNQKMPALPSKNPYYEQPSGHQEVPAVSPGT